jgi:hypothetical protein
MKQLVRIGLIAMAVSACGGSDGPNFGPAISPTPTQQAAITSSMQYLSQIANASVEGQVAASAAIDFAFAAPALVGVDSTGQIIPDLYRVEVSIGDLATLVLQLAADGCQVVTDHSVTWNQCQDDNATIDGTMSWSPGHVEVDLHATSNIPSLALDYEFSGSMTVSDAAIQSDMTVSYTATSGAQTVSDAIRSQLDVELASGCIYRGTMTLTETGSGSGAHNGAVQVVWIGCNLFKVRNG